METALKEELVQYTVANRIARLRLNRPDKKNALNEIMVQQLKRAFYAAEKDPEVKVIVLEAAGDVFSAGADLVYLQKMQENTPDENLADSHQLRELFSAIYLSSKITVANVPGHAIAGGCGLITVCDFVYAAEQAQFGYTEVKIGFVPAIVALFLVRKIGEGKARDLLLSGRLIKAEEAKQLGLVQHICSRETLNDAVNEFAERICLETSADSIEHTKYLIRHIQEISFHEALVFSAETNARVRSGSDFRKGIASFVNKSKPRW